MELGVDTDTYDSEGAVTAACEVTSTEDEVRKVLSGFMGRIMQVPPMYSAKKIKGVPLYKLARKGVVVEREANEIEIFENEIVNISLPFVEFRISCSRGTYVRSICHDAGRMLGCGGRMTSLRRLGCGEFSDSEAISPDAGAEELAGRIIPLEEALRRVGAEGAVL